jgi:hypothetical protein
MADSRAGRVAGGGSRAGGRAWLSATVAVFVVAAGVAKALLFRDLEYHYWDLYTFLEMSWSWRYAGHLLHDNVYGAHGAIHNFYILPLLSPLTIPLGAYGLVVALTVTYLIGALRVARTTALDQTGRVVVLAALLGPVAFFVFDNPAFGFHPELFYPPLVALLVMDLLEGRHRRAILPAVVMLLVKEDGAVLLAAVLLVYFAWRLWSSREAPRAERRRLMATAALTLLVVTVIFAAGMTLLALQSEATGPMLRNAEPRLLRSLKILGRTVAGEARSFHGERLRAGLTGYALVCGLLLLPLGRRLPRGLALFLLSAPVIVILLSVSSAHYRFQMMLWPPRLAHLLALVVACLAHASAPPTASPSRRGKVALAVLVLISWSGQLALLNQVGYSPLARLNPTALVSGRGFLVSAYPADEVRLLRCVAAHLPGGLPVEVTGALHAFFHRQSIVFKRFEKVAWHSPRLRVVARTDLPAEREKGWCLGPAAGEVAVEAECDLIPAIEGCGSGRGGNGDR